MKKKCKLCKKKIKSVLPNSCKCGNYYCGIHKSEHNCEYDYMKDNQEKLKISNPKLIPEKINNKIY